VSAAAPLRRAAVPRPQPTTSRPTLRLVATRPLRAGRLPFALLVGGILAVGLVSLLMLHTLAAQDAFRLHDLQGRQTELRDAEQQLALDVQRQEAPHVLADRARALGMLPTGSIAFVEVRRHGKVVGVVEAPPTPAPPAPEPSATASADRTDGTADKPDKPRRAARHERG
jgi:hypothetical protein